NSQSQDANSLIAGLRRITVLTAFSKIISLSEQKKWRTKIRKGGQITQKKTNQLQNIHGQVASSL
ncbi:unnamed protein product, partial [Callosobruchus maculatus]